MTDDDDAASRSVWVIEAGVVDVRQVRVNVASDILRLLGKALIEGVPPAQRESAEGVPPAQRTPEG